MLAAASSRSDRTLESVKLALRLKSKNQPCPDTLKVYFRAVIQQTIDLLNRPAETAAQATPDAISLAVRLTSDEELRSLIQGILEHDDISSDQAEKALNSLEASFDTISESAHFSREIYAAI